MVLMNGSKKARYYSSLVNQNQGGGPKKMGSASTMGKNPNLVWAIVRQYPTPGLPYFISRTKASANIGSVIPHPRQS